MTDRLKYTCIAAAAAITLGLTACSDDNYSLPSPDLVAGQLVEGVAFSVEHDSANPNIIHLKSLMDPRYSVAWITPQGRRNTSEVTLQIPFNGQYEITMGVDTRGGYVWSEPYAFSIDDFCAEFVDHYLWTRLSGGVGQSKTWQLDLAVLEDGSKKTTVWQGPHWFWNPNYTWDHLHSPAEDEHTYANYRDSDPWDAADAINPADVEGCDGADPNWYWGADYAGNSWMCKADNYGYMTFDLIDGANVTITDADGNVLEKGTYLLDTDLHTITFSGVYPLDSSKHDLQLRDFKLLYLSDTAMQIIPDGQKSGSATSGNYVTKDFIDNYTDNEGEKEPVLPEGWMHDVSQTVVTAVKWVLSERNPLDWAQLDGTRMNGWENPSDYPDWLGTPNASKYADFSMTLDSKDSSAIFHYPDGEETACSFTLDEKGIYTFSAPVKSFPLVGWASFGTDASNSLRITAIEKDVMGSVAGMWLGARSSEKDEYMVYHFIPQAGAATPSDPLSPWINALCGKTFTPNTDAFVDWLNFDCTGGWTTPSTFGSDYTSNGWIWNEGVAKVAQSALLSFSKSGGKIMATLTYTKADGSRVEESGEVAVNSDIPSLSFPFPMIDYSGTAANWIGSTNDKGAYWTKPLASNEWLWVAHPEIGNNLGNVSEKGFWLGRVANASAAGDSKDEIVAFWWKQAD